MATRNRDIIKPGKSVVYCPLCQQVYPSRDEAANLPLTDCPLETAVLQLLQGEDKSTYISNFLLAVDKLVQLFAEENMAKLGEDSTDLTTVTIVQVKSVFVRLFDATSLYSLRFPTEEEKETSEVKFSSKTLEQFSAWMKYAHKEKQDQEWFGLLKLVNVIKYNHREELAHMEKNIDESTERA